MCRLLIILFLFFHSNLQISGQSMPIEPKRFSGDTINVVEIPEIVRYWEPLGFGWMQFEMLAGPHNYFNSVSRVQSCILNVEIFINEFEFDSEQDFLNYIRKNMPRDNDPTRFSDYHEKIELEPGRGKFVVGFSFSTFDKFWSSMVGQPCTLKGKGFLILHPNKKWIIKADVSERGTNPFQDEQLNFQMKAFLDSIEIIP